MDNEPWHLDKRVPLALILAIILQTATALWWAATIDSKVAIFATKVSVLEQHVMRQDNLLTEVKVMLARIDERTAALVKKHEKEARTN